MLTWLRYLDRVIRGEATRPSALRQGDIEQPVGGLAILGAGLGAIYGLCMGCFALFQGAHSPYWQLFATVLKVPCLFFLTLAVTFPALYVFNALVGSHLSMQSVLRLLVISLAVMLTVLASLGPIVAFFSAGTTSYPFMVVLNTAIFAVSGFLGLRYMLTTLHRLNLALSEMSFPSPMDQELLPPPPAQTVGALEAPSGRRIGREALTVFRIWIVVFGLVGAQMAWVLRPFIGSPDRTFTLFRVRESNFFEALFNAMYHLFR